MNRRMRARKHIFPRRDMLYLPSGHPLSTSSEMGQKQKHAIFDVTETNKEQRGGVDGLQTRPTAAPRRRPGGFLFDGDRNAVYVEDLSYMAAPEKGDGRVWVARRRDIPMGRKRLLLLLRLIKGLQLTDAIDWLQALALHRCNSLLNVLLKQQQQIRDEGADTSRVYIQSYIIGPAGHVKTMQVSRSHLAAHCCRDISRSSSSVFPVSRHQSSGLLLCLRRIQVGYHYRVSFLKSYRYSLALRLRELPLHELFHRTFILKQPPRSLTHDMRLALRQKQLPPEAVRDWIPFLDAPTRYSHKRVSRPVSGVQGYSGFAFYNGNFRIGPLIRPCAWCPSAEKDFSDTHGAAEQETHLFGEMCAEMP